MPRFTKGIQWVCEGGFVYATMPERKVRIAIFSRESCIAAIKALQENVVNRRQRDAYAARH